MEERSELTTTEASEVIEESTTTTEIAVTTSEETTATTATKTTTELPNAVLLDLVFQTPEEMDRRSNEKLLKNLIEAKMTQLRFRRPTFMQQQKQIKVKTLLRQRVAKSDPVYSTYHCPQGYGYYLIEGSGCTKYKRCEDWNQNYVSLTLDKCAEGVFDFNRKTCVPADQYNCDEDNHVKFVAE